MYDKRHTCQKAYTLDRDTNYNTKNYTWPGLWFLPSSQMNFKKISIEKCRRSALLARCLQNYYIVYVWKNVSYTFLLLLFFFFEIRLTRGDVWAKTKVQDIQIIIKVFSLIKYSISNKNMTSPILTLDTN